ncbi:MAG: BadF/BadG/BcrA/BcrD ATPase family protein, partial [Ornithinimicrobium sp.]
MSRVVAFDVGKSGCRVALFVDRRRVASAEHPSSLALADRGGAHRAIAAMTDVMGDLPGHLIRARTPVDAVGAGVAGLSQAPDALEEIADQLADRHPGSVVALSSDMTTSHLGALGGRPGVVVAAGTGAVSLSVSPAGESARVDGWGYLLGDCGSGYDIARRGLDSALRAHDGRSGSDVLRRLATERFGDLDQLPRTLQAAQNPPRLLASFAHDVLEAAKQGDASSRSLWH